MQEALILVLDEGTTSTRAMLFGFDGKVYGTAQRELTQHYPKDGWVEHDADEIWEQTLACAREMVEQAGGLGVRLPIAAIAITNQRETVVAWDKETGEPLCRAIVWQDRRTFEHCARLKERGLEPQVQAKTGLLLDPYFSATKMAWMLENEPEVRAAKERGTLAFGTVESWLTWKLTGGAQHISDASNASRTLLLPLEGDGWDEELCTLFGVPIECLPDVVDNAGALAMSAPQVLGRPLPICGLVGDQQAATIGQGCLAAGEVKATFGTGAFVLASTAGALPKSDNRLLGTVLAQIDGERIYALEGSVFVAGSLIKYLRDELGLIASASDSEALARSVPDNGGVSFVPALSGLGAPFWQPDARGAITGLSFASSKAHIVRAGLEAMAHQTYDLARAFAADGGQWGSLKIDGGMAANNWMAQDIADILGLSITRPQMVESTALGAAMCGAIGAGAYANLKEAYQAMGGEAEKFTPQMAQEPREKRIVQWEHALKSV